MESNIERIESLKMTYEYLDDRYKEQSAALGIITFFVSGISKILDVMASPIILGIVMGSLVPMFVAFVLVFIVSMYILDRQLYTPGFEAEKFIKMAEYQNPHE